MTSHVTPPAPPRKPSAGLAWQRTARRLRVPLGFAYAALFLVLARPSPASLAASLLLTVPGILLRAYASGYVTKNEELTTTGPYRWTRNPLYLGSLVLGLGFALSSRSPLLVVLFAALFAILYVPVILAEEQFLRSRFPQFDTYAAQVPRLLPRLTRARSAAADRARAAFSGALYRRHREYNCIIGATAIYAVLLLRIALA